MKKKQICYGSISRYIHKYKIRLCFPARDIGFNETMARLPTLTNKLNQVKFVPKIILFVKNRTFKIQTQELMKIIINALLSLIETVC